MSIGAFFYCRNYPDRIAFKSILSHALNPGHIPNPYGNRCHNLFRFGLQPHRSSFAEVSLSSADHRSEESRFLFRSSMKSLRVVSPPFPVTVIEYPSSLQISVLEYGYSDVKVRWKVEFGLLLLYRFQGKMRKWRSE